MFYIVPPHNHSFVVQFLSLSLSLSLFLVRWVERRYHVPHCQHFPNGIKKRLNKSTASVGSKLSCHGTSDYWSQSCQDQLGLADVELPRGGTVVFYQGPSSSSSSGDDGGGGGGGGGHGVAGSHGADGGNIVPI